MVPPPPKPPGGAESLEKLLLGEISSKDKPDKSDGDKKGARKDEDKKAPSKGFTSAKQDKWPGMSDEELTLQCERELEEKLTQLKEKRLKSEDLAPASSVKMSGIEAMEMLLRDMREAKEALDKIDRGLLDLARVKSGAIAAITEKAALLRQQLDEAVKGLGTGTEAKSDTNNPLEILAVIAMEEQRNQERRKALEENPKEAPKEDETTPNGVPEAPTTAGPEEENEPEVKKAQKAQKRASTEKGKVKSKKQKKKSKNGRK